MAKKEKGSGIGIGAAAIVAIIAGVFTFGSCNSCSLGLPGGGNGNSGNGNGNERTSEVVSTPAATTETVEEAAEEANSNVYEIVVTENEVLVNGEKVEEGDFERYIQEVNTDGATFTLKDDHAIAATYSQVTESLNKLGIQYSEIKN